MGYCVCIGGAGWHTEAFVPSASRTSGVGMRETHMDRRMEEADSYHCVGLSEPQIIVTDGSDHLSSKLWSFVGNRHPPPELQSCSTSPIQRRGLEWGRGTWGRLRLNFCYCFCKLAHTTMMLVHNRLHSFLNFTFFLTNPRVLWLSAKDQLVC